MLIRLLQHYRKKGMIRTTNLPAVIDLFSGCGGLSWGFKQAGFPLAACMDVSEKAIKTYKANSPRERASGASFLTADIESFDISEFKKDYPSGCIVIGGPPCQAYSRVGRGKLNSLGSDRHHLKDSRGRLYEDFLKVALELNARAIVMENVVDSISYGGQNIPETICADLLDLGYEAAWSVLNSANYGVPQVRERVILVAFKSDEGINPVWPTPTHAPVIKKQTGTFGSMKTSIKLNSKYFVDTDDWGAASENWISVGMAFSDLPSLRKSAKEVYNQRRMNEMVPYTASPKNSFQQQMRKACSSWQGTTGHVYRNTGRDFEIFERMLPGHNYIDASKIASELLADACHRTGISPQINPVAYETLKRSIVPPYAQHKFDDKWKKLELDKPSRTVVAHLSVDTYSHIHPVEPRGISVREAARLQSFPDDFLFWGNMGDAFKQIGNAVPPLLSLAIAQTLSTKFQPSPTLNNYVTA
jgi:DNA (cytosine-5)-methyltransferase 1